MERMISGIKPTGRVTLGNYLGAIKQFIKYKDEYELLVFIADLHSLTTINDKTELKNNITDLAAIYSACGLQTIFLQSEVPAHAQLEWVLTCNTTVNELTKMPQYKNFVEKNTNKAVPAGMLMYPSLMNADILLYNADIVPVGMDQLAHIDLTRDIAEKFNSRYGNTFKIPKGITPKIGCKIMSLTDPTKKMSKSESDKGTIYILDDLEVSKKKIMKALTDSENSFYYDPENKPGLSNLITIYAALANCTILEVVKKYFNVSNYGIFKRDLCNLLEQELKPIQEAVFKYKNDGSLRQILDDGSKIANNIANKTLNTVYEELGLR